jgi:hypothetical protein
MDNKIFPELNEDEWTKAYDAASAHGLQGLVRALRLTTTGISNAGSRAGTGMEYLKNKIENLNTKLEEFNESSGELTKKALNLTKWIMIATVVSSIATAIVAIDILVKWLS